MTRSLARNDRKRDVGDAVPYNGSSYPSVGGDAHSTPVGQMRILRRDTWVPPYRIRRSCRAGRRGRRTLQRFIVPIRRERCPQRPVGQMRILRRDTWVPPYRIRRSCRAGRRGRRTLQRFIVPIRRERCPQRPVGQMRILRRDTWVPPYRVRRSCRTGRRGRRPLQRLTVPVRRRRCPHRPVDSAKRQAQAPASLFCIMRFFTWRSWRPRDRRGRPSDSAP